MASATLLTTLNLPLFTKLAQPLISAILHHISLMPELPTSLVALPDASHNDQHGPTPPTPHQVNYIGHQHCHSNLQKMMTLYFQECNEDPPSIDPIHTAMLTIDNATISQEEPAEPVDKYLPEPQSLKAVLKLDDDIRSAWLHAIRMEIKNLIDHGTFILGQTPSQADPIIPVKLVLKAKQTATGKLEKLKARLLPEATWRNVFKESKSRTSATSPSTASRHCQCHCLPTPKVQPIEILNPLRTLGHPVHLQEGQAPSLHNLCFPTHTQKC
ncbi:hypothetical protein MHU86_10697 [Fragilaria crotonensis]|nr:hypothetical protein MHU86_10697 [Fragilaria crotonensis]